MIKYILVFFIFIITSNFCFSEIDSTDKKLYSVLELDSTPKYSNGNDSLMNFLNINIGYIKGQIDYEGYIYIIIEIDKDGNICEIYLQSSFVEKLFLDRVKDVFSKTGQWIPGTKKNFNVKSCICIPLALRIN